MTFCTETETVKAARKAHQCTWCAQTIEVGSTYKTWRSFDDSCFINKMHPECEEACRAECSELREWEYMAFDNERPTNKGGE